MTTPMNGPTDMSQGDQASLPGGDEATAAEYVLGLLQEQERRDFERVLAVDADLQQDIAAWRAYFSSFVSDMPDKVPHQNLFAQIEAGLPGVAPVPMRKQIVPYVIGAVIGAALCWIALWAGWLPTDGY